MPRLVEGLRHDEALTLERALVLANQNDEQLSIRGEQYLQSLIARARAAAAFLPTIGNSAGVTYSANGSNNNTSRSIGVSGSISLFNLRSLAAIEYAAANAEQQRLLLLDLQQTVLIGVAQNFYQVLKNEESLRVFQDSLALRLEQVRDIQARTRLGIVRPLDLAQAQADASNTRVSLLQAESAARDARTQLAFLIGVPSLDQPLEDRFQPPGLSPPPGGRGPGGGFAPSGDAAAASSHAAPADIATLPTAEAFEQDAIDHRLDFAAARQAVEAASLNVKTAIAQYYPEVNLNLSYLLYTRPGGGNPYSIGLSLFEPLYNAGLIHQDIRATLSSLRQAVDTQVRFARVLHQDIQLAYEDFITSTNKLSELEVGVVAAQRAKDLAVAQYRVGNATNLDQLTSQNQLLNAQLQLNSERYNQKVFYLNLLRASGRFTLTTPGGLPPIPVEPAAPAAPPPAAIEGPVVKPAGVP